MSGWGVTINHSFKLFFLMTNHEIKKFASEGVEIDPITHPPHTSTTPPTHKVQN